MWDSCAHRGTLSRRVEASHLSTGPFAHAISEILAALARPEAGLYKGNTRALDGTVTRWRAKFAAAEAGR